MLPPEQDLENRRPVWIACSDLFLDTELEDHRYTYIGQICSQSPYSWTDLDAIMFKELWPALAMNLQSTAGEWAGWTPEFIENRVLKTYKRRWKLPLFFSPHYSSFRKDWEKVRRLSAG